MEVWYISVGAVMESNNLTRAKTYDDIELVLGGRSASERQEFKIHTLTGMK
jgi:hypothetical protein